MAKKFCYVCAGILMLALSYHFGADSATAQAPGNPVVAMIDAGQFYVCTVNGDVFRNPSQDGVVWSHVGNVFAGPPVPAARESFGAIKARYR